MNNAMTLWSVVSADRMKKLMRGARHEKNSLDRDGGAGYLTMRAFLTAAEIWDLCKTKI